MPVSEVSPTADVTRGGYRAPDRRAKEDHAPPVAPPPTSEPPGEPIPLDAAFYAGRFRADLSQLGLPVEPQQDPPDPSESHGDPALFDFFGNLSVLLLAVRSGDLPRAQAAANALEMEVLVERSAGRRAESASAHRLVDLSRLVGAAQSRDEIAARAAAKDLAAEFRGATAPALAPQEPPPALVKAAPVPALVQLAAPAQPDPPPDPYAQHDADSGSAVYDTLSHYFDAEAQA